MIHRTDKNRTTAYRLPIEDLSRLRYEVQQFFIGGAFDLYEDERRIAKLEPDCAAVEISYGKLVLACWGEGWSLSWRIVGGEWRKEHLRLDCAKGMGRLQVVLTLRRGPPAESAAPSRGGFADALKALIEAHLPGVAVEQIIRRRDDARHLSGIRPRLILKARGNTIAAVAVGAGEAQEVIDATLGEGLVWLEELRRRGRKVGRLALFVPRGKASTIACRLTCVAPADATISLYEVDAAAKTISPVRAFEQAELSDNLRRAAQRAKWAHPEPSAPETVSLIDRARELAPEALDLRQRGGWIYLSIRGLNFARISVRKAVVEFGLQPPRKRLTPANHGQFAELIRHLNTRRQAAAENRGDPIFRAQAEGWLESLVRRTVSVIDPALDRRFVYSQMPAYRGEQRTYIDLLAATRSGRLVVMELKVSEDPELPFQGLDYWLRIDWHRRRGDFERRGYFKGLALSDQAPLLYLVAPLFRFHATTKLLAGKIAARVPVFRIGINEDWRKDLRVLLSERLNG